VNTILVILQYFSSVLISYQTTIEWKWDQWKLFNGD